MAPIYERVFNIASSELQDERFLSWLRKSGLGESLAKEKEIHKEKKMRKKSLLKMSELLLEAILIQIE